MRHAHIIGCEEPLLWRLVSSLVREMGNAFPELERAEALVSETLKLEETRFRETLGRGLHLLNQETDKLGDGEALDGDIAFRLYDTFGFPLDLTEDVLRGQGRSVDKVGFEEAMERQRSEARKNWTGSGSVADESVWFDLRASIGATEFLGYTTETADGVVVALIVDGSVVDEVNEGSEVDLLVNQTPFYGSLAASRGTPDDFRPKRQRLLFQTQRRSWAICTFKRNGEKRDAEGRRCRSIIY